MTQVDQTVSAKGETGHSEFVVAGLLAVIGCLVLFETSRIDHAMAGSNPIGPRFVPTLIGVSLLVVSALLALDVARGGRGESEVGEDVDLSRGSNWRTLLGLVAVLATAGQLIPFTGFPVAGMILFFGTSRILGSRRLMLDLAVSVAVPGVAFLLFTRGLGVYLPAGPH